MDRKTNSKINTDPEIIDLRMQSEDLINNIEYMTQDEYNKQAQAIKDKIELRIAAILSK